MPNGKKPLSSAGGVIEADPVQRRADQLAELLELCTAAHGIAEAQGEKFLAYMLAMTIQAARGATRGPR